MVKLEPTTRPPNKQRLRTEEGLKVSQKTKALTHRERERKKKLSYTQERKKQLIIFKSSEKIGQFH